MEEYLLLDLSKYHRSIFAQFRCGILPLQIEIGRYRNIHLSERVCQICNNEVEDEIHFLLSCNAYAEPRSKMFRKAYEFDDSFFLQNHFEQFTFLLSNLQKTVIKFLASAIAIRTKLLTIPMTN